MNLLKNAKPWLITLAVIWVLNLFIAQVFGPYLFSILISVGISAILAVSLNLVNGFTGQFSMGHAGFMSVGAYVSAMITLTMQEKAPGLMASPVAAGGIFLLSLYCGGVLASLVGYLVGLPSLRLKGDYLAIVTLGFGEIIRVIILNINAVGGARGLPGIPQLTSFGWLFTVLTLTVFVVWRVIQSSQGRRLLAVREDEIAADSMGVNSTQAKVRAFVLGSFFAGVAGGLYAHYFQYLNPATFDFNRSFEVIIMVVLGGMGSLTGSVLAAVLLTALREALRPLQELTQIDFRMVIYSLFLIVLMLTRPNGLLGTREWMDFVGGRFKRKEPIA